MRLKYRVVTDETIDVSPESCRDRKQVDTSSVDAVRAAFGGQLVFFWNDTCWDEVDSSNVGQLTEVSRLKVVRGM
eukprot:jgi/Chrzof1/2808/UNPLg00723.t1